MYIHNFQHGLMNKFGRYSRVQCVCGSSDELPSSPSFSYKKFSIIWDIYGSRIVPGKKNIFSGGRHLIYMAAATYYLGAATYYLASAT